MLSQVIDNSHNCVCVLPQTENLGQKYLEVWGEEIRI